MLDFHTNLTNLCLCLIGDHANFTEKETQHKMSKDANKTEDLNDKRIENNNSGFVKKESNYVELIW